MTVTAGVLATALLNACVTNWQVQPASPARVLETTGETEILATLVSGADVLLRDPAVQGDSLVGWQPPTGKAADTTVRRWAYPLNEVRSVSVKRSNTGANIAIGAGIGAAAFFVTFLGAVVIVCSSEGCD